MKFVKKASAQIAYKIRDLYNCVLKSHTKLEIFTIDFARGGGADSAISYMDEKR